MYVRPSLVDECVIDSCSEYRQALEQEDVEEVGSPVQRPSGEVWRMYQAYRAAQLSDEFCEARCRLYGE